MRATRYGARHYREPVFTKHTTVTSAIDAGKNKPENRHRREEIKLFFVKHLPVMVWRARIGWMHSGDRARQRGSARAGGRTCVQVSDRTGRRPLDRLRSFIRTLCRLPLSLLRALLLLLLWLYRPIRRTMATSAKDRGSDVCDDTGELIRNYHKQAFEFISLALQIDEDDKGMFFITFMVYI